VYRKRAEQSSGNAAAAIRFFGENAGAGGASRAKSAGVENQGGLSSVQR
jgi:hypothetical protein